MTQDREQPLARLLRAAAAVRIPESARSAHQGVPPEPESGQIWRARWNGDALLVLLTAVNEDGASAAPLVLDDRHADENTLILPASAASLSTTVALWTGLSHQLPMHVLDRLVGNVLFDVNARNWIDVALGEGATRGGPIISPLEDINEVKAELEDTVAALAEARLVPAGTGEISKVLSEAGFTSQSLVALLSITPQRSLALLRGQIPLSPEEAAQLAPTVGLAVTEVLAKNPAPPSALVRLMSRPRRRAQVCRLAVQRGIDEMLAWVGAIYSVNVQAARQTGSGSEPAWEERIDRYFEVTLETDESSTP